MATIVKTVSIDAPAESAWDALRAFWGLHEALVPGFVVACEREGDDVRAITFFNGAAARERLVGFDDERRRLAYSVIESSLGFTHHNASAEVIARPEGGCEFVWITDALPDAVAPVVDGMMDAGIATIKHTLETSEAART